MSSLASQIARARKLVGVLRAPEYGRALRHGVAASVEHEAMPLRSDFRTVIDVGANRGQFAVFAARRFPRATLICFEPLRAPRAQIQRVVGGIDRLRLFDVAIGATNGPAEFHISAADDSSSLLPIGLHQREAFPGTEELSTMIVPVRRLEDVLQVEELIGPVLLKVDVQGGELGVLQGAEHLLHAIDAVLVEVSFVELYTNQALADEVWGHLRSRCFSCRGGWSMTYGARGRCLHRDLLFARDGFDPLLV